MPLVPSPLAGDAFSWRGIQLMRVIELRSVQRRFARSEAIDVRRDEAKDEEME